MAVKVTLMCLYDIPVISRASPLHRRHPSHIMSDILVIYRSLSSHWSISKVEQSDKMSAKKSNEGVVGNLGKSLILVWQLGGWSKKSRIFSVGILSVRSRVITAGVKFAGSNWYRNHKNSHNTICNRFWLDFG